MWKISRRIKKGLRRIPTTGLYFKVIINYYLDYLQLIFLLISYLGIK